MYYIEKLFNNSAISKIVGR